MRELEIIQHKKVKGLSVFFDSVEYRTPHFHPEWELLWILDGALSVTCEQKEFLAGEGELLLFSPNQPHEFHRADGSGLFLCLQISQELLNLDRSIAAESVYPAGSLADISGIKQKMLGILRAYLEKEPLYETLCTGQACLLMHEILAAVPFHVMTGEERMRLDKRNARLSDLITFVDENYMHKIRLSAFAQEQGCSLSYLSHFVKEAMNQSFQEYVNSVRVNCACKLIASGSERLLDVCEESGFSDYRYFSAAFKKQFGMTPEQYRNSQVRPEGAMIRHSLHSLERFYTEEESKALLERLEWAQNQG